MRTRHFFLQNLTSLKNHPRFRVIFAWFTELLLFLILGFAALLSMELLLPTFISARINLSLSFSILLVLFILHSVLASWLSIKIRPLSRPMFRSLVLLIGLWGLILIILSLLKFPLIAIGIIILSILSLGYLFRKI